jgi:hypothetical protein
MNTAANTSTNTNVSSPWYNWRNLLLLLIVFASIVAMALQPAIKQDLAYHQFIDTRTFFAVPNFYNVISNLPFLFVGLMGIALCLKKDLGLFKYAWLSFFIGVALVSFGSAYYHFHPNSQTLVWDRLPMTIGFMGLFAAMLGEFVDARLVKYGLIPLLLVGLASVMVWQQFDDLRFYAWVQFMPLLVIPMLLVMYRKKYTHSHYFVWALFFYLLAKVFEHFDRQIFHFFANEMSGHAIKHVLAAIGSWMVLKMLQVRKHI